ncbi:hypothetical protein ACVDFE_02250 [Lentzea chajnantorensis]
MGEQTKMPPWFELAGATLAAAARRDYGNATRLGQQLAEQVSPAELPDVLCAWIDTVVAHSGLQADAFEGFAWVDECTGEVRQADDVMPPQRWAGRLFWARAKMDRELFHDLIRSVSSEQEWQTNVSALLLQCGEQLRHLGKTGVTP